MTEVGRRAALEAIAAEVRVCDTCRLHRSRTNAVPGEGSPDTEVVFVGEGPGFNEDQQGRPFVGAAGGLLNELLAFVRWRREDVFIANVVKCRPPGNRDPEPDEIAACSPFLRRQLEAIDPAVIVTLGRHSLASFAPGARIGGVHGTARPIETPWGASRAVLYAMYHPAAAFRQTALKETLFADMANLPQVLVDARRESRPAGAGHGIHADAPGAPRPLPDPESEAPDPGSTVSPGEEPAASPTAGCETAVEVGVVCRASGPRGDASALATESEPQAGAPSVDSALPDSAPPRPGPAGSPPPGMPPRFAAELAAEPSPQPVSAAEPPPSPMSATDSAPADPDTDQMTLFIQGGKPSQE